MWVWVLGSLGGPAGRWDCREWAPTAQAFTWGSSGGTWGFAEVSCCKARGQAKGDSGPAATPAANVVTFNEHGRQLSAAAVVFTDDMRTGPSGRPDGAAANPLAPSVAFEVTYSAGVRTGASGQPDGAAANIAGAVAGWASSHTGEASGQPDEAAPEELQHVADEVTYTVDMRTGAGGQPDGAAASIFVAGGCTQRSPSDAAASGETMRPGRARQRRRVGLRGRGHVEVEQGGHSAAAETSPAQEDLLAMARNLCMQIAEAQDVGTW